MRLLFKDRGCKVIFLNEVIEELQQRIYGQFIDSKDMRRVIVSICKILPHWARIVTLPRGYVVRIDGIDHLQIGQIKQSIQEHFEKAFAK